MAIHYTKSAEKHGYTQQQAEHAITNAIHYRAQFNPARYPQLPDPDLYIGPAEPAGQLIEVMLYVTDKNDVVIFHVMHARPKMLALFK